MEIEIKIDNAYKKPKIVILTDKMTEEIETLLEKLSSDTPQIIAGFQNNTLRILSQEEIYQIYASGGKVFARTDHGEYSLRLRLYEAEERLGVKNFVRISNSEIINLEKVKTFDLSFSGTIRVCLTNGAATYVSRRYVTKIKKLLGI